MDKLFKCSVLNPGLDCPYTVTGEEITVIDQASGHEVNEHGFEDTPELRKNIADSLIDVAPSSV